MLTLALFLAAAWAIHRELAAWTFADIADAVGGLDGSRVALAILAAALSYAVLSLYDPLALRHQGNAMPLRRGALASFVGYAFSHAMGMPLLTGGAVRYRLYSAWGLPRRRDRRHRRLQQPDAVAGRRRDAGDGRHRRTGCDRQSAGAPGRCRERPRRWA